MSDRMQHPSLNTKRCDIVAANIHQAIADLEMQSPERTKGTFMVGFIVDENGDYAVMRPPTMSDDAYRLFMRQIIDHIESRRAGDPGRLVEVVPGNIGWIQ